MLDDFFNREVRKSKNFAGDGSMALQMGREERPGLLRVGRDLQITWAKLATLSKAPTAADLAGEAFT
ncbi:MAG: hypothetical protein IPG58_16560 [Acidobacteria bacterium]|nr:hypothetical protein [Acidobacteriota bacterium]